MGVEVMYAALRPGPSGPAVCNLPGPFCFHQLAADTHHALGTHMLNEVDHMMEGSWVTESPGPHQESDTPIWGFMQMENNLPSCLNHGTRLGLFVTAISMTLTNTTFNIW